MCVVCIWCVSKEITDTRVSVMYLCISKNTDMHVSGGFRYEDRYASDTDRYIEYLIFFRYMTNKYTSDMHRYIQILTDTDTGTL